jgi:hypothetical protein
MAATPTGFRRISDGVFGFNDDHFVPVFERDEMGELGGGAVAFVRDQPIVFAGDQALELEFADDLLGWIDVMGAFGELGHDVLIAAVALRDGDAVFDGDDDFLEDRRAILPAAGGTFGVSVLGIDGLAGFGGREFDLRGDVSVFALGEGDTAVLEIEAELPACGAVVFLAQGFEIRIGAAAREFGGIFIALENFHVAERAGEPLGGVGLMLEECGFLEVNDALAAPEVPTSDSRVFDESADMVGIVFFEERLQESVEIGGFFVADEEVFVSAAEQGRVDCEVLILRHKIAFPTVSMGRGVGGENNFGL